MADVATNLSLVLRSVRMIMAFMTSRPRKGMTRVRSESKKLSRSTVFSNAVLALHKLRGGDGDGSSSGACGSSSRSNMTSEKL